MKNFIATILLLAIVGMPLDVYSEMSSATYLIYADSVNTGGILSTGGSFGLEDTVGEVGVGNASGGTYEVRAGYQAMVSSSITMTVSSSSINLGTLDVALVRQASSTISITTEYEGGYTLSLGTLSGSSLSPVADGAVTAGSEEFGFSATGFDSRISGDTAMSNSMILAASSTPVIASEIIVTFKASISAGSAGGSYSQSIPLIAAANL